MNTEKSIQILIYTHAFFGGAALLTGFISIVSKKGKLIHKKSGKFEFVLCIFFASGFYRFVKKASKNKIQKKFTTKTG